MKPHATPRNKGPTGAFQTEPSSAVAPTGGVRGKPHHRPCPLKKHMPKNKVNPVVVGGGAAASSSSSSSSSSPAPAADERSAGCEFYCLVADMLRTWRPSAEEPTLPSCARERCMPEPWMESSAPKEREAFRARELAAAAAAR